LSKDQGNKGYSGIQQTAQEETFMTQTTVVEYVVDRLSQIGITDCFGIPGDFAFPFNDAIASHKSIQWVGCSNELNASYAVTCPQQLYQVLS
jgi:hypothetical protein